ncbi:MAG: response regulator [Acidobacteria bacterium]|nr:response regulator [Acidobacteriota bacterium]
MKRNLLMIVLAALTIAAIVYFALNSLGTLAGGVAHDFNNIVAIILGNASFIKGAVVTPQKLSRCVDSIEMAVQRGTGLVKQLLTFARKTDVLFESVQVNESIHEMVKMLKETFPKTIEFSLELDPRLACIPADRNQLYQVLLNLCVNARDAMPRGGRISIKTETVAGDALQNQFPDALEEQYVCITVVDTGAGIEKSVLGRIFEPFFMTKEPGKGTGLGLAVLDGVVKAHRGFVGVESQDGKGTAFKLYLPFQAGGAETFQAQERRHEEAAGGTETVLLVEDEVMLQELVKTFMEAKGYLVLTASDGEEASAIYRTRHEEVALVLCDMGLPKLGGWEAYEKMKEINPSVKVLFAGGYVDSKLREEMMKAGVRDLVQKPYSPNDVLKRIREVLDGSLTERNPLHVERERR